jgi:hypothetical protein
MAIGLVLFVVLLVLRATGRLGPSSRKHSWEQNPPYNPLLDPGNPASPLYPNQLPGSSIDPNPSPQDGGGHHGGGFDGGGHH